MNTHYSSFNVEIIDSQAKYLRMRKKGEEEQNDRITSPMPGKVVKIPVSVGTRDEGRRNGHRHRSHEDAEQLQSDLGLHGKGYPGCNEGDSVNANQVLIVLDIIKED